jgi:hypothetical protein
MISNTDQCSSAELANTLLPNKCGVYGDICKELCYNITAFNDCNARADDCFWLYNSSDTELNDGECRDKDDESLTCLNVRRSTQCPSSGVKNLDSRCIWKESECVPSSCSYYLSESAVGCKNVKSSRGSCFLNFDVEQDNVTRPCSDVVDITSCNDLKSISLCILADKNFYPSLQSGEVSPTPCTWDVAGSSCISNDSTKTNKGGISPVVVVLIVVLVTVVLLAVGAIITIIIYERKVKMKREKAKEEEDQKAEEMKVVESSLASSKVSNKKESLIFCL